MDNFKIRVIKAQNALKAPKNQRNTFGNYNYRSCEDILEAAKPICKENNLLLNLSDEIILVGDRFYIKATATLHDTESDESLTVTALARESADKKGMDDSQITGTASSYARKYALNGLFCVDDTKDADTDEYKRDTTRNDKAPTQFICSNCQSLITPWVTTDGKIKMSAREIAHNSEKEYGRPLCIKCIKNLETDADK